MRAAARTTRNGFEASARGWKAKITHELIECGVDVVDLEVVFPTRTTCRRPLLTAYDIDYTGDWIPLVEAPILGKAISIGGALHPEPCDRVLKY